MKPGRCYSETIIPGLRQEPYRCHRHLGHFGRHKAVICGWFVAWTTEGTIRFTVRDTDRFVAIVGILSQIEDAEIVK